MFANSLSCANNAVWVALVSNKDTLAIWSPKVRRYKLIILGRKWNKNRLMLFISAKEMFIIFIDSQVTKCKLTLLKNFQILLKAPKGFLFLLLWQYYNILVLSSLYYTSRKFCTCFLRWLIDNYINKMANAPILK